MTRYRYKGKVPRPVKCLDGEVCSITPGSEFEASESAVSLLKRQGLVVRVPSISKPVKVDVPKVDAPKVEKLVEKKVEKPVEKVVEPVDAPGTDEVKEDKKEDGKEKADKPKNFRRKRNDA